MARSIIGRSTRWVNPDPTITPIKPIKAIKPLAGQRDLFGPETTRTLSIEAERAGASIEAQAAGFQFDPVVFEQIRQAQLARLATSTPSPSATGVTKLQTVQEVRSGGLDWLSAALYVNWSLATFQVVAQKLNTLRSKAEADQVAFLEIGEDGDGFQVEPYGVKKKGRWVLKRQSVTVVVSNQCVAGEDRANVYIEVPGCACLFGGCEELYRETVALLEALGMVVERAVPSRADFCVDIPGLAASVLVDAYRQNKVVARSKNGGAEHHSYVYDFAYHGNRKGIYLRIYDRLRKVKDNPKAFAFMVEKRWGCVPKCAVRVEFEVRRKKLLNQFGIMTVDQLFASVGAITQWLCNDWFRLTEEVPDRENGHAARSGPSELWQKVIAAFQSWAGENFAPCERRLKNAPSITGLVRQLVGCGTTAAIVVGRKIRSVADLKSYLSERITDLPVAALEAALKKYHDKVRRAVAEVPVYLIDDGLIPY